MKERQAGNLLPNVLVSLVAGGLGCFAILMVTHGPGMRERLQKEPVSATAESGLRAESAAQSPQRLSANANSGGAQAGETRASTVFELQAALKEAAEERAQLSATLVTLNRQLSELQDRVSGLNLPNASADGDPAIETSSLGREMSAEELSAHTRFRSNSAENQYEGLLAAGLDEQSARELQNRADQYQLSRLELFDQAAREGWDDSDQLRESLEELEQSRPDLRTELGDSVYDQYLYEAGNSNRIAIDSVISGSAASQAGLQVGDMIISYAGERTFGAQDLQQETRSGTRGDSVQVVFERDGQTLSTDMLRGPLGVTLRPARQQP